MYLFFGLNDLEPAGVSVMSSTCSTLARGEEKYSLWRWWLLVGMIAWLMPEFIDDEIISSVWFKVS